MKIANKQVTIVSILIISVVIICATTIWMLRGRCVQRFGDDYSTLKHNISAHIESINQKYGEELKQQRQKDANEILSNNIDESEAINEVLEVIDIYEKQNTLWDGESNAGDETHSACEVTYGFSVSIKKPKVLPDGNTVESNEVYIIIQRGFFGAVLSYAEACNTIIYNNAKRQLYKFLDGKISARKLDKIFDELLASIQDTEIIKKHKGINYKFEYFVLPQEIRVAIY